ncbi:hypothetical protein GCM10009810_31200 [Nostocoides vanveenii]|uniref:Uncharacterized protein n=1 Tax=Nostocoides vanveenii TaxID=330835 RepID=A0ABP4X5R0_9MICO
MELPDKADKGPWLEHLSSLYQVEFSLLAASVAVGAIAAPLVVGFLTNLPPTCTNPNQPSCVTDTQLLVIPLVPLLTVLALGYVYLVARVIGKYTRNIERAISGDAESPGAKLRAPALSRLNGALFGGEAKQLLPLRIFYVILAGAILGTIAVTVAVIVSRVHNPNLKTAGFVGYGIVTLICLAIYNSGATHSSFEYLAEIAKKRDLRKSKGIRSEYVGWSHFIWRCIFPRPLSAMKEIHGVVIAVTVTLSVIHPHDLNWRRFLLGLLAFELILYQTRYLLNGVRENPSGNWTLPSNRRNDPQKPYTPLQVIVAVVVSCLRIWLFYTTTTTNHLLQPEVATWVIILFLSSFYAYEIPREICRFRYRNAVAKIPAEKLEPLPQDHLRNLWDTAQTEGGILFVAVGSGYALRAFVAYILLDSVVDPGVAVTVLGFAWLLGMATASAGWAMEFNGAVDDTSGQPFVHPGILAKPQLLWIARRARLLAETKSVFKLIKSEQTREGAETALYNIEGQRLSPWRRSCAAAVACSGLLPATTGLGSWHYALPEVVAAAVLLLSPWPRPLFVPPLVPAIAVGGPLALALSFDNNVELAAKVSVLAGWALFTMHGSERNQSLLSAILGTQRLAQLPARLLRLTAHLVLVLIRAVLGDEFWRAATKVFGRS